MTLRARIIAGLVLAAALALTIWLLGRSPGGDPVIRAEFTDARGLVSGNDVRINGAPAGSVTGLTLTDRDTALVTMRLDPGLAAALKPRADASAAIRPVDLLGDNYVALEPGHAAAPLRGPIPTSRTLNAPRLSDLLSAFSDPARAGLQALLVELGRSLDQRGVDLNQAALQLRPTLQAADAVMSELGSQNAALRNVIADSEAVTAQAAARNQDLARSVSDLNQFVQTTAQHLPGLDAGLQALPSTLRQLTTTAAELRDTATKAQPLASALERTAPGLSTAAHNLPSFLDATAAAVHQLHPTLRQTATVLGAADPTLHALGNGLGAFPAISQPLATLAAALAKAAPGIAEGFFVNFPDQGSEPGNQPLDPFVNALRDYWRGAGVMSCQSFGLPIAPGCLSDFLSSTSSSRQPPATPASTSSLRPATRSPAGTASKPAAGVPPPVAPPPSAHPQSPSAPAPLSPLSKLLSYLIAP
jgi:phospholipid/cholesterol/gamma-HCH transport system substrate-binding protein